MAPPPLATPRLAVVLGVVGAAFWATAPARAADPAPTPSSTAVATPSATGAATSTAPSDANGGRAASSSGATPGLTACEGEPALAEVLGRAKDAAGLVQRFVDAGDSERARLARGLVADWIDVCVETRKAIETERKLFTTRQKIADAQREVAKGKTELEEGYARLERLRAQLANATETKLAEPRKAPANGANKKDAGALQKDGPADKKRATPRKGSGSK